MRASVDRALVVCALGTAMGWGSAAGAQAPQQQATTTAPVATAAAARPPSPARAEPWRALESNDPEEIQGAIRAIQRDHNYRAIQALGQRIEAGLPPRLLDAAVDALIAMGRGPGAQVLVRLTRHRRAPVRAKAAAGLVATRAPNARRELVRLLDDPSPVVRAAAARALGELGAAAAFPELLNAAQHGVPEAATVVGATATSFQAARLLPLIDEQRLDSLAPVLEAIVGRSDLPERSRQAIVARLVEVGSPGCYRLLQRFASALPEGDVVRQAAAAAVEQHTAAGASSEGGGQ